MVGELTVDKAMRLLFENWISIVVAVLIFAFCTFAYSFYFIPFEYTSEGTMIVTNDKLSEQTEISKTQIDVSTRLVDTYKILLTSNKFCEKVAKGTDLGYSAGEIRSALSISAVNDTEVLSIKVTTKSAEHSYLIAQYILDNAQEEIKMVSEAYSIRVIDAATIPRSQSYPNITLNTMIGAVLGFAFAIIFILVRALLDTKVKSEEDLLLRYPVPILGAIPKHDGDKKR